MSPSYTDPTTGSIVHLSPVAATALRDSLADTIAGRRIDPGAIHPACRRRLYDLRLLDIAPDGDVILTDTGRAVAEGLAT